jgi:hypothetical protein
VTGTSFDISIWKGASGSCAKEPRDLADRDWHAGPNHRDVAALFSEAYERLKPGGRLYVMFSSDSELDLIDTLIERAGLKSRIVQRYLQEGLNDSATLRSPFSTALNSCLVNNRYSAAIRTKYARRFLKSTTASKQGPTPAWFRTHTVKWR